LQSKGNILLSTDADTNYAGRDVILQTVLYAKTWFGCADRSFFSRKTKQLLVKDYDTCMGLCKCFVWRWLT
ncbi:MAG TPA: hypothetical protein VER14_01850, partial [Phototrophicaceae bacterium]|nr:hypothetical protein [Phototrophicaceae bacterium]